MIAKLCWPHAGGLAAPALAAVAGTVMTGVGAGAAATGLTTGIVGSSVGMAAAFGAIGARSVGDRMSRRLGKLCFSMQVRSRA